MISMNSLKAVVHNGRLVLDEPTNLPEGTVVELVEARGHQAETDPFADMPEDERERLGVALAQSEKEFAAGEGIAAIAFLIILRSACLIYFSSRSRSGIVSVYSSSTSMRASFSSNWINSITS